MLFFMINYEKELNAAQLEAVSSCKQASLVIAGAGSGKTRTIIYRLAWLIEHGAIPESILLLTFTRKAAQEMLGRAASLLPESHFGIAGGTFHSFAYGILRKFPPAWLNGKIFSLMDAADIAQAIRQCKEALKIGKKDSSFPKTQTVAAILSKSRNKEMAIEEVLRRESFHLLPHAGAIEEIGNAYTAFKKNNALFDYDDLLFELENLLVSNSSAAEITRSRLNHILVDEYQDTNLIQARITRHLAGAQGINKLSANVMAVGDEAQSIYAFRGANIRNILDFPKMFPDTHIIRLEENYRSTQPILDMSNNILENAKESFNKKLFSQKKHGVLPKLVHPATDSSQAELAAKRIKELLDSFMPSDIAVLFRSGFHSYPLENVLRRLQIPFRKYGGMRLVEAAHVKDILSFARLAVNPLDLPAFGRIAEMHKGVGPKTIESLHLMLAKKDAAALKKALSKKTDLLNDLVFIDELRIGNYSPCAFLEKVVDWFKPRLELRYPDDWPRRMQGLEEILQISQNYDDLDLLLADMVLESKEEDQSGEPERYVTLSTVHSAKGLEWKAVLLIDMVEDRFPSRHAQAREEDFEEERRLFYVACTRAKDILEIYSPLSVYSRADYASIPAAPSVFLQELDKSGLEIYKENWAGELQKQIALKKQDASLKAVFKNDTQKSKTACGKTGYCRHKLFGRGKIIKYLDEEKVQVHFPGFGIKTILAEYLQIDANAAKD